MKAKILDKNQEKLWDKFVATHPLTTIHQTTAWGVFQTHIASRNKRWIIGLFDGDTLVGGTMLIRHQLPKGYCFLYSARGPLLAPDKDNVSIQMATLLAEVKKIAKDENAVFYRIDPPLEKYPKIKGFRKDHGFQPEHTLLLDLTLSEEDLLKQMKQKGRYNIKLAAKKGVSVRISNPKKIEVFEKDISAYYQMLKETTSRDGFSGHNKDVYKNMVEILSGEEYADFYIAEHEGDIIAAAIMTKYNDTVTYYYGVSSNEKRNLMAPYLLQWQAIKDGKKAGFKIYDFLGIAPEGVKNHPWAGVTNFKTKFGGTRKSFAPAREHVFKPVVYWAYKIYKILRRR